MKQTVIGVTTEWHEGHDTTHPYIKRIMKEEIGKERTNDTPYAKGNFQFERVVTGWRASAVFDVRLKK